MNGDERAAPVVDLEERRLLPRHCQGDAQAFVELVQRYRRLVYGYLVRCGLDPAARDDLFQEIFLKLHAAAGSYHPDKPLRPWLFTIVANTVRTHYRRLRVRELVEPRAQVEPPAVEPEGPALLEAQETARLVEATLVQLSFAQREVLALHCVEGLTQHEVAEVLDQPVATIKSHLHRGRELLARALTRERARARREVRP